MSPLLAHLSGYERNAVKIKLERERDALLAEVVKIDQPSENPTNISLR